MHGVLRRQAFNDIIEWQYDPYPPHVDYSSRSPMNDSEINNIRDLLSEDDLQHVMVGEKVGQMLSFLFFRMRIGVRLRK